MTRPITKKNLAMVKEYLKAPEVTKTEAYSRTHNIQPGTKRQSLYTQATEAFRNPAVKTELAKHNQTIESAVIDPIIRYKDSNKLEEVRLASDNAKWAHDKIHGKSIQKVQTESVGVTLSIDLTGQAEPSDSAQQE